MSEDTSKPKSLGESIPDPEVKPEGAKIKGRRYLTRGYKIEILRQVDACKDKPAELGALLRKEGLYSSSINIWKKERDEGKLSDTNESRRGPKPDFSELEIENLKLKREIDELKTEREHALKVIEAQKKIAEIFGAKLPQSPPKNRREKP